MKETYHNNTKSRQFKYTRKNGDTVFLDPELFPKSSNGFPIVNFLKYFKSHIPEMADEVEALIQEREKNLNRMCEIINRGNVS